MPAHLAAWLDGGVAVWLAEPQAGVPARSCFPAMLHAMLTVRFTPPGCEPGNGSSERRAVMGSVTFHTLSTGPSAQLHPAGVHALGLLVRPAAAAALLRASTGALIDRVLEWREVAGKVEAERLIEGLHRACSDAERMQALFASFGRAMAVAARGQGLAPIEELALGLGRHGAQSSHALGLSRRQLERRCQALWGLTPKRFQRLHRLRGLLSSAVLAPAGARAARPLVQGVGLALDAGFYDQPHMARELRQLAGAPLGELLTQAHEDGPWWSLASHRQLQQQGR